MTNGCALERLDSLIRQPDSERLAVLALEMSRNLLGSQSGHQVFLGRSYGRASVLCALAALVPQIA